MHATYSLTLVYLQYVGSNGNAHYLVNEVEANIMQAPSTSLEQIKWHNTDVIKRCRMHDVSFNNIT